MHKQGCVRSEVLKSLKLTSVLVLGLLFNLVVSAANSVTLVWDPSPTPSVTGYYVYYGNASQTYSSKVDAGNATTFTVSGLLGGRTYYFAVTAYDNTGQESDYSNEMSWNVPRTPVTNYIEAESATLSAPMTAASDASASGGSFISSLSNELGSATFNLNISQADDYVVWALVQSQDNSHDSVYVSIDGSNEDIFDTMTNNYSSNWKWVQLSGRNNGNPRLFSLTAGSHNLTIRSRESGTMLDAIYITNDRTFAPPAPAANTAPTLNSLANITVNQNSGQQSVTLSGISSGSATENQNLTVRATSSNTGLIPNPSIVYTSPASTGTLRFTPVANASGSAVITVTVDDGQSANNTVSRVFTVTVLGNQAPSISKVADQTIAQDASTAALAFSVNDVETSANNLTVTAVSSNTTLVSASGLVLGGSGANRTIKVTPAAGQSGATVITLTVSDGSTSTRTTFVVTVTPGVPRPPTLLIITNGVGSVTPNLNTKSLAVNKVYSVSAIPASGMEFAGWTGSVTSSNPRLTFVYKSGQQIAANFIPSPFTGKLGVYNGLVYENDQVRQDRSGAFSLVAGLHGVYSGRLTLGAAKYSFRGKFGTDLQATNTILTRTGGTLTLKLVLGSDDQITGQLSASTWLASLSGDRLVYNTKTAPAPYHAHYTLIFPSDASGDPTVPEGHGYGAVRVMPSGMAICTGTLGDGTKLTQSGYISKNGQWPFFASLYSGKGTVLSWLTFADNAESDLGGQVSWVKSADPRSRSFAAGFRSQPNAIGSVYNMPAPTAKILEITSGTASFSGSSLASEISNAFTLTAGSRVVNTGGNRLMLSFVPSTGTFRGTLIPAGTTAPIAFSGAVLQKRNDAFGLGLPRNENPVAVTLE